MKNYPKKNYSSKPFSSTEQNSVKKLLFSTKKIPITHSSKDISSFSENKNEEKVVVKNSFNFSTMKIEHIPYFLMINLLYAWEFNGANFKKTYQLFKEILKEEKAPVRWKITFKEIEKTCSLIIQEKNRLDEEIEKKLINWEMTNLNLIKKTILRWAFFFLMDRRSLEEKKIIPYAIYFAKCLGEKKDYKFINGILDSYTKEKEN